MCGIVGIWNQADREAVAQMARSVSHRGPDGLDYRIVGNSSYGASRLAIVGEPYASAIFHDPESGSVIMLNGEIYNIELLRTRLVKSGCVFRTDLESEVILHLYRRDGLNFVRELQGMFAIAIADDSGLVLARDRIGIKPLYYSSTKEGILFGSEIKAILAYPGYHARLNISALEEITVFGYIHSRDTTLFENIHQIEPGTIISFSRDGQQIYKYWRAPEASYFNKERHLDYPTALRQLKSIIIESLDNLLSHGSHPFGIYLSGGIDSTILTLVAKNILGYPVTTFTLSDDSDNADLLAAKEVSNKLGTHHIERKVSVDDYFNTIEHFVEHYEAVVAGGVFDIHGGIAFHLLSETVSNYVKVALSGEGADELFGGYYWIYTHPLGFADRIRNRLRQLCSSGEKVFQIVNNIFPLPEDEFTYRRNLFNALIEGGLSNYHLQSVDRSAGAFGFEVRPAYLFDELADFALNLPIEYKVPDKQITKRILKEVFMPELEKLGLDWVTNRLKIGMPAAISSLEPIINQRINDLFDDTILMHHPLRNYLLSKTDMYLFNIFAKTFLPEDLYALPNCVSEQIPSH
jgi:asparagine synthase (glutamine-hydrolysing)